MTVRDEIWARWQNAQVQAVKDERGNDWVWGATFGQAMQDIMALLDECDRLAKSKTNAERKARQATKQIQGSQGDTSVKGVAEQALCRTVGANARSDSNTQTTQSQSVSVLPGEANEASNRVAVGQTSGSSDLADAEGSTDVEGRQSLHLTTSRTAA